MKDGFVIYTKYEEQIKMLTDTQAGVLLRAMISHQKGGPLPKMDGMTTMAFTFIRQQIDAENQKQESISAIRKEAGKKGGRPSKSLLNKGDKAKKANGYLAFEEKANESKITKRFLEETTSPLKESSKEKYTPLVQEDTPLYPPKGGTDEKEKFFSVYCQFKKFAKGEYPHIDFTKLLEEFDKSASLRKTFSWQLILDSYNSILAGNFRDKVDAQAEGREYMAERERYYTALRTAAEEKAESIHKRFMQNERYAEIDKRLRTIPMEQGKAEAKGDKSKMAKLEQESMRLRHERRGIIEMNGLTEEDIEPKITCHKCQDTGYNKQGALCDCYKGA